MTTKIWYNEPALGAPAGIVNLWGDENLIIIRADDWGGGGPSPTEVYIARYSADDYLYPKYTLLPGAPFSSNQDICLPCSAIGQAYAFWIGAAYSGTQKLLVEMLWPACCGEHGDEDRGEFTPVHPAVLGLKCP